jgi:serine/threonine-protein kinase RIM15
LPYLPTRDTKPVLCRAQQDSSYRGVGRGVFSELRRTVRELRKALDRLGAGAQAEFRGIPIFSPAPSPSNSISQFFKPPLGAHLQKASMRKLQHKLLGQIEDILQVAVDISAI